MLHGGDSGASSKGAPLGAAPSVDKKAENRVARMRDSSLGQNLRPSWDEQAFTDPMGGADSASQAHVGSSPSEDLVGQRQRV